MNPGSFLCAQHGRWLRGERPQRRLIAPTVSGRQGRHCEVGSRGSRRQTCDLRDTNFIRGHGSRASWPETTKPDAIKGWRGKWSKGAGKVNVLTWGDLLPGHLRWQPQSRGWAEGAGVSRGYSTGRSQVVTGKGRTVDVPGVESSRNEHRRPTSPDRGPAGRAKVVKPLGLSQRAEQFPAQTTNKG